MRKRTKSEKPTLFEKAVNSLGWAWYSLKLKVSSLFPKREKIAKLGAKRRKDAFFVYGMLLLPPRLNLTEPFVIHRKIKKSTFSPPCFSAYPQENQSCEHYKIFGKICNFKCFIGVFHICTQHYYYYC